MRPGKHIYLPLLGAMFMVLFVAISPAGAQDSQIIPEEEAKALHSQAVEAYKKGRTQKAIALWQAAEKLVPHWKYSFNLAAAFGDLGAWQESWQACMRTREYGIPPTRMSLLDEIQFEPETELLKDHALLFLSVTPENATVTLNGDPWEPPYRTWAPNRKSEVEVKAPGYKTHQLSWDHTAGKQYNQSITLSRLSTTGTLIVRGSPAEANVSIDDRVVGRLPEFRNTAFPVGPARVDVAQQGYSPFTTSVQISPDGVTTIDVMLEKVAPPEGSGGYWPWIVVGVGGASLIGGAVFTYMAADVFDSQENLDPNLSPQEGDKQYDALEADLRSNQQTSFIFYGVGAAAVAGGIVWWLLADDAPSGDTADSGDSPTRPSIFVLPREGGAFAGAHWRF